MKGQKSEKGDKKHDEKVYTQAEVDQIIYSHLQATQELAVAYARYMVLLCACVGAAAFFVGGMYQLQGWI